ncbi:unnamed protein product [Acanthosepion pharaonis]|uniref:Uncharacterized protein n=1 Tax=Acanthosepion pharaonis TaxID=158019 RepID=A0A812BYK2_ACAPH|nr:unnamed protein product [Sepia pharaonis]
MRSGMRSVRKRCAVVCVRARPRHFHRLPAASQDVVSSVTNRIAAAECLFFPRVLAARLRVGKTDRRTVYVSRRSVHLYPRCRRRRRRLRQGSTSFVATDTVKPAWRGSSSPPPSHRRVCPSNAVVMLLVESPGTSNVCSSITRRRRRLRRLLPHFRSATNGSILHAILRRPVTVSAQSKSPSSVRRRRRPFFVYHHLAGLRRETRGHSSSVKWRPLPGTLARSTGAGERLRFRLLFAPPSRPRSLLVSPSAITDFVSLTPAPCVDDAKDRSVFAVCRWRGDERAHEKERYLVDPASSHMLVSKLKPCKCKFTPRIRTGETANGSGTGPNPRDRNPPRRRWITVAILELIHVTQAAIGRRVAVACVPSRAWAPASTVTAAVGGGVSRRGQRAARSALVTLDNSLVDRTGFHAWRRVSRGSALSTVDGRLSAYRGYYGPRDRNEYTSNPLTRTNRRASLVPAAAVIPAPVAYIKVVAVKKLVVRTRVRGRVRGPGGRRRHRPSLTLVVRAHSRPFPPVSTACTSATRSCRRSYAGSSRCFRRRRRGRSGARGQKAVRSNAAFLPVGGGRPAAFTRRLRRRRRLKRACVASLRLALSPRASLPLFFPRGGGLLFPSRPPVYPRALLYLPPRLIFASVLRACAVGGFSSKGALDRVSAAAGTFTLKKLECSERAVQACIR